MKKIVIMSALVFCLSTGAASAAVGKWFVSDGVKLRLVTLRNGATAGLSAGLQIVLEPGWKTYWRSPGSSGLPPKLDFSTSMNVSGVEIKYPTPITFGYGAGLSSGYQGEVIFPIEIQTSFPEQDVVLKVQGLMGVCDEICIPMQFSVELTDKVGGISSFEAARVLARARDSLPVAAPENAKVLSIQPMEGRLDIVASVPVGTKTATLFLEGPADWYLSPVKAHSLENDRAMFSVEIPKRVTLSEVSGNMLRATLVIDGKGFEHEITAR